LPLWDLSDFDLHFGGVSKSLEYVGWELKLINQSLLNALSSQVRTITRCLLITRTDGEQFGFTEFDQDLTFAGVTYRSLAGLSPTAVQSSLGFESNNLEFSSLIVAGFVTESDFKLGLFDYARVNLFLVNFADLPTSLSETPPKFLSLPVRTLGKVSYSESDYSVELMGLSRFLEGRIGEVTSATCRYNFGDSRCGVNVETFETNIAVTTNRDRLSFFTTWQGENDRFTGARATWELGDNSGIEFTIIRQLGNTFFLAAPMAIAPVGGDTFLAIPNCQKSFENCRSFDNTINFGGEDKLPGLDALISNENQE
jgi:uncharacterized phage protein (TIGR02218 family)